MYVQCYNNNNVINNIGVILCYNNEIVSIMGCINIKVVLIFENIRICIKKERKMLKKVLKKQGIIVKVIKSGVVFEILIFGDFWRIKLFLIGKLMEKKEYLIYSFVIDVIEIEIKCNFYKFIFCVFFKFFIQLFIL